ncbi:acetate--CoA ligase family protein [Flavimaricola marinus]|uniref:CoA-binding domain-containing protein n=1 Tax=Flavimaricola marinus TaxID=1819565 RepID=A0A238LH40_9RHOB|nr:acetate--CoA ligase family protein [Flavimaricola marinus]SMY08276.1 hypothetical protein LOM8899_02426 [Flavimaricola marinus]
MRDLSRLLRPRSVAVIGGGAWCRAVVQQLRKAGFAGKIWPVHTSATQVEGLPAFPGVAALPAPPDAAFVGINRDATIPAISELSRMGAGGAVCFASGFAEVGDGATLHARLLDAAADMPILGPNCYGFINAFDGALLWPDQHGCSPVTRGVAILTQSSNIAINLTMQARALPIGYVVTCGNQAQTTQAQIARALLDDPRVTAIGLHIEGFGDLADWQALARDAAARGIPLVALKIGASDEAQVATVSHTASLAGSDAGAQALLDRLGIARVSDLGVFLETLKLMHGTGPLPHPGIASISCSGGEASLAADTGARAGLRFPLLSPDQTAALHDALGPKVTLSNPLDYHTYIWRDAIAMARAFIAIDAPDIALTCLIVDYPRADRCDASDWACATSAAKDTAWATGKPTAMLATLPELMPEDVAQDLLAAGVVPLSGLADGFAAIAAAVARTAPDRGRDLLLPGPDREPLPLTEAEAKATLSAHGLAIPAARHSMNAADVASACTGLRPPFALKGEGHAHKSDAGAVVLGLATPQAAQQAAEGMDATGYLIEEMISDAVAELLVGVVRDPAHGFVLTLGAGGILTELWQDSTQLLIPASRASIETALGRLRIAPLLTGFRGRPAADLTSIVRAVEAVQGYVLANADRLAEVEVNPLLCTPTRAVAVDALIRIAPND